MAGHTYTCPHCNITSQPLASAAEATQMLTTHLQVQHGHLGRREPQAQSR
ncbi:hypothetical protein FF36_05995 [Frankia torreyi]|uniref:Uncharacterized protein n=1 Tax=Frankia torreyi TaxID=1856 RepID=A0A0D8B6M3_9ACTN|nr:hypothetical protein [Frankia torreyi]KJE19740.1 hypothetical protein FF36_05995 [Frankia torreyi]KQM01723.1 hypothetical protein FF86_11217 [Frankia sp. CpI1-P]